MKKNLQQLLFSICLLAFAMGAKAQTVVTVDTGQNWIGYMNVFDSTGTAYLWGSGWALADMKTTVDSVTGAITLKPNFNTYNAADPYWSNGTNGNKFMEANSFVEDLTLVGQNVTFQGTISSNTLNAAYTTTAFVKALDPNNSYATVVNQTVTIGASGIYSVTAAIPNTPGLIVQYGFTVWGINANPTQEAALGNVVLGYVAPPTIITLDTSQNWFGYMNVFDSTGTAYLWGSGWSLADLKTTADSVTGTVTLQPNFNTYNATDPYWANGTMGNKVMEANTIVEDPSLIGQNMIFQGNTNSNDLDSNYDAVAFIKVLDPMNSYATILHQTSPLPGSGAMLGQFSVQAFIPNTPGLIVQYGFTVTGMNANPTQETALGSVVLGPATPLPVDVVNFIPVYKNGNVLIEWNTTNEQNLLEYEIQKSKTSTNFETFTRHAAYNESQNSYLVIDPFVTQSMYYRLKVIDMDGTFKYSSIKKIEVPQSSRVGIYPNPAQNVIRIVGNTSADIRGAVIYSVNGTVISTLNAQNNEATLNISSFPVGIYWLKLRSGQVLNFLKQ